MTLNGANWFEDIQSANMPKCEGSLIVSSIKLQEVID